MAMSKADSKGRILFIEDDKSLVEGLRSLVEIELGYAFECLHDGQLGLQQALEGEYSIVVIDANLPSMPGFEVCRRLRATKPTQPIVLLTGRTEEIDKVLGLELGADDYVTKPFSPRELAARMKALIRRSEIREASPDSPAILEFGRFRIDFMAHRVWIDGALVDFTRIEFELFGLLAQNPGRVFERSELLEAILGYTSGSHDHALTVHFSRIRAKIELNPNDPIHLKTVRGVGYRFDRAEE